MKRGLMTLEVKLFVDGKEVTNFFADPVQLIEPDSPQAIKLLKRYDDFSGKITLTRVQGFRLIMVMYRDLWKQIFGFKVQS